MFRFSSQVFHGQRRILNWSSRGSSGGGISRDTSKPNTSDGVAQRNNLESMEDCVLFDRGDCKGRRSTSVGTDMVEGVESMEVFSDRCVVAGEGLATSLEVAALGVADANIVQSETMGVLVRTKSAGKGNGSAPTQSDSVSRRGLEEGDGEADQMEFEGGSKVAATFG